MSVRRGNGGTDWGNIDWSNIDWTTFSGRRRRGRPPTGMSILIAAFLVVFVLIPLVFGPLVTFLTDLLWFRSLGYEDVFLLRYRATFMAFAVFLLAYFLFAAVNLYFALRPRLGQAVVEQRPGRGALALTLRLLPILLIPAFFFGLAGAAQWDVLLRWLNAVPFGTADPVFGRDIGFYFFTLPILEFVRGWLLAALVVTTIGVVAVYGFRGLAGAAAGTISTADLRTGAALALPLARPARVHLSVLAALFLALVAGGYLLDQLGLLFRSEAVLTGAGYTSVNARLPALGILAFIVAVGALLALANAFARTLWLVAGGLGLWVIASVLLLGIYPTVVQNIFVNPDQLNQERPYLERHIEATRDAYGLSDVEESAFNVVANPRAEDVNEMFTNTNFVRLWDWRPLLDAYQQLQALRQYYAFHDVDLDRYDIDGASNVPVMFSGREFDVERLPREARTWVNEHIVYTHGFGAVLTAVGGVTPEGLPRMEIRDIPPQGEPRIDQPRIYYGELTKSYVIVGTTQAEFDFPQEGREAVTRFSGAGGVGIGSLWDRLLFALRYGDGNILVSTQIGPESRILFDRQIAQRARKIAPFLTFDSDPYLVIADGQLYWIHDAYTTGSRYPYSQYRDGINYIRNSVKVVTNAYDGSVTFYVVDTADPVIRNLRGIYPSLFAKDVEEMPAALSAHIRYPEDIFSVQVDIFSTFHMRDPEDFYNRNDAWRVADEIFEQGGAKRPVEPYYITTVLPGSTRPEFVLFIPMTPAGSDRDNMVAWIAGRADPPEYGNLRVLRFPRDRLILGPLQIEARIEADGAIRQELTLLTAGRGANVIRGNQLVLPLGESFLYVKPLFVQASEGRIPELRRVILATQDRVVMEPTFELALARIFGPAAGPLPTPTPPPGASPGPTPTPAAGEIAALVREASQQYEAAQEALRRGDFAEYGRQIALLEQTLARLRAATGQ